MKCLRWLLSLCLVLLLSACGKGGGSEELTTTLSRSVLKYADITQSDPNVRKKYFLVAGGNDAANFAEEIIEQKKLLLELGAAEKEIVCFYSIPYDKTFREDENHFRALANDLSHCYPAFPKFIWEQMKQGGVENESIYVYITSHGSDPLSVGMRNWDADDRKWAEDWLRELPEIDQYFVDMKAAGFDGEPYGLGRRFKAVQTNEYSFEDLFVTPRNLKKALRNGVAPEAKKFIAIQACHSGGFIDSDESKFRPDTLQDLEKATVMTAARYDRASFGCGVGNFRTYFGGAFNDLLKARRSLPQNIDWQDLYREVSRKVKDMEETYYKRLDPKDQAHFRPSEPMFFSRP